MAQSEEPLSLSAVRQEWVGDTWRGEGEVRIVYQDVKIQCAELEYDRATMDLVASGGVVFDQGPKRFACDELHYNLRTKTGIFLNAEAEMPPNYHFSGREIEKLDETNYRIEEATFTSCDVDTTPPWDFRMRSGLVEQEGYGRFRGTSIRIKHVPVFYLPYVLWPVKQERAMGLLAPRIGYSQIRGALLGSELFVPIGRSYDTTVQLDLYSEKYLGLGSEWRWAPKADAYGEIMLYLIRVPQTSDPEDDRWQWKINGRHKQDDFLGFKLLAEVNDLSDIDFFQEFDRTYNQNTRRSLYSFFYLTRSWGPYSLNMRADSRTTFITGTDDVILRQLPELELRSTATRIANSDVYWNIVSSLAYLDVDRGGDLASTYPRADLFPSLWYTIPGPPWLTVTPKVGGRATWWGSRYVLDENSNRPTSFVDEPIDRTFLAAGVDIVGPSFSRVFDRAAGEYVKFKHLIEPRISYSFLSDESEDDDLIPLFDEVDSFVPTNRLRLTLVNRFFGKSGESLAARELGSLEISQLYSFSEPLNYGTDGNSQWGPLGASLRLEPLTGLSVDARASWDTLYKSLRSTSLAGGFFHEGISSRLTWYQGYTPSTGERSSSQVRFLFGFRQLGFPLNFNFHVAYDVHRKEFQQQMYQIGYEGSCWGVSVEYRDLAIGLYPTRDWRVVISLTDVGKLPEIHGRLESFQ